MRSGRTVSGQGVQVLAAELALSSWGLPHIPHSEVAPSATQSCDSAPRFVKITAPRANCARRSWRISVNVNVHVLLNLNVNFNININSKNYIDINTNSNINVLVLIIQEVC